MTRTFCDICGIEINSDNPQLPNDGIHISLEKDNKACTILIKINHTNRYTDVCKACVFHKIKKHIQENNV